MRLHRLAPLASLTVLLAACATDTSDVTPENGNLFVDNDEQTVKMAGEIGLAQVTEKRPDVLRGAGQLSVARVHIDERGEAHDRLAQKIDGIPVFGAGAIAHLDRNGDLRSVTDYLARDLRVETTATISESEATKIAYASVDGVVTAKRGADLQILPRHQLGASLTYRVQLEAKTNEGAPSMPVVFVDARSGEVVLSYDNLQNARNRSTYTANTLTSLPGTLKRTEGQAASGDAVLDAAHDHAGLTYDFYFNNFGRDSYDGQGAKITSTVHYDKNYVNAFWNGTQMVYGDGNNVDSTALTVLDVVGHELTHAVTEYSSGLVYQGESGALNEAMSDIFGASIEAYRDGAVTANTWKIGEECWTPGTAGDALRYMNDPQIAGDYDYYPTRYTGSSDNGGVHWNSGIANLAFYLAVAGGTHPRGKTSNVVPALAADLNESIQKGAAIFYRANTAHLGETSTFSDARTATANAAAELYGANSPEVTSINEAWSAVGVTPAPTWIAFATESGVAAQKGKSKSFSYATPAGATQIKFETSGGTGDADLYVKFGSAPTTASYDCRPYQAGNNESCAFNPAKAGTYYVMVRAYSAYSGVTLKVSYAQ
ncbi:M4 family metallopeptidase [Polyangium aurulentum]|uniref:M4 family metallopeptidase n=1 Tax=Polyangium aurulentum TaxID=2567896 RepID=UPI0010ADD266|nr:M4 family metallopeptidase [Polyangium aurulentum]UQA59801.1 M4 family metallopeptidase [Polyangium aurulentum]